MRVLFLGEGSLKDSGRYLAAILKKSGIAFDHRPDGAKIPKRWRRKRYDAVILSDYRHASFTPCAREWLKGEVSRGTGLLMIGGWASFTGLVGGYAGTDIEKLLPVTCLPGDDRVQKASGSLLLPMKRKAPGAPMVCGYHRARPKPGSRTTMVFRDLLYKKGRVHLGPPVPALVLGSYGRARTAAFLTDCAPHWAGGLVDWGRQRTSIRLGAAQTVEVGNQYLHFFHRLIRWVADDVR
jgi:uncharacterized membrane protein